MKRLLTPALLLLATPAFAAEEGPFVSLHNPLFVATIGFLLFLGILIYFKVPRLVGGLLDKRAETITKDLSEARALRDEAQALLASFERKQREVKEQAERIIAGAREDAADAAVAAKAEIASSVARRLAAAEDQIKSAEDAAVKEVRDRAISVAMSAAREVIAAQMTAATANKLFDEALATVEAKLH